MHAEGVGDGADRPVLGVEEATDLSALEQRDHRRPSAPRPHARAEMGQRRVADEATGPPAADTAHRRHGKAGVRGIGIISRLLLRHRPRDRPDGGRRDHAARPGGGGSLMRHFLAGVPPAAIAGLPGGVVAAPASALLVASARGPPRGVPRLARHRPASSSDRPGHTGGTGRRPDGSLRGRRRRTGTSPRAPRARRGGWTIPARYGKTRTRRIHAPCEIWPEGPGWQDSGPSPTSVFGTNRFTSARPPSASAPSRRWPPSRHLSRLPRFLAITNTTSGTTEIHRAQHAE